MPQERKMETLKQSKRETFNKQEQLMNKVQEANFFFSTKENFLKFSLEDLGHGENQASSLLSNKKTRVEITT